MRSVLQEKLLEDSICEEELGVFVFLSEQGGYPTFLTLFNLKKFVMFVFFGGH